MKRFVFLLPVLTLLAASPTRAQTAGEVLTMQAPPKSGVVVAVNDNDVEQEPVQARWLAGAADTDKRGVSQIFTWASAQRLSHVGLKLDNYEHKLNRGIVAEQDWEIDIEELDPEFQVKATVATVPFRLTPQNSRLGTYLVVKLPVPLKLRSKGLYGLHLRPVSPTELQRIYIARTARGMAQIGALGNQTHGNRLGRYGASGGDHQYDIVCFLAGE